MSNRGSPGHQHIEQDDYSDGVYEEVCVWVERHGIDPHEEYQAGEDTFELLTVTEMLDAVLDVIANPSGVVLQERRTLDQVIVAGVRTYENGCNYRLVQELGGLYYLEYGCDGVLVNLVTGDERLLYKWFIDKEAHQPMRRLSGVVSRETITHLLTMDACRVCGGARYRTKPGPEETHRRAIRKHMRYGRLPNIDAKRP